MSKTEVEFESRLAPLLLAFAKDKGLSPERFVEALALPADILTLVPGKATLLTPAATLAALARQVGEALGDPHVGLTFAEWLPRGFYGVAEFLVRTGPTLRQSFENFVRFNAIVAPYQSFHFETSADGAAFSYQTTVKPNVLGPHLHEYSSAVMTRTVQSLCPTLHMTKVWFSHPRPEGVNLARLHEAYRTEHVVFDEPTNGFSFDSVHLDGPVVGGDVALYSFLEEHALAALASRPKEDDFIDKLRHLLRDALKQGEPNVERLATRLNMSGRTLQRRLSELKTSFQEVLDHVRFDLARQYLKDVRLDVSQVAYLLGYSELRAFDRAFRRWADRSPTEWRTHAGR